jgi:4'-phosphopantetheinyl transferase
MLPLERGSVDVWLANIPPESACQLALLTDVLSWDERQRLGRFVLEAPRLQYLTARALLRKTLSKYADVNPRSWIFSVNAFGKPRIAAPVIDNELHFNLSHCDGLVAIAIARTEDVGIDVENVARGLDIDRLAPFVFADDESAALAGVPVGNRREHFFAYWTLKEAYVKARGMGLSLDLRGCAFKLVEPNPLVTFKARCPDVSSRWRFWRYSVAPRFALALAAPSDTREVRLRWIVLERQVAMAY